MATLLPHCVFLALVVSVAADEATMYKISGDTCEETSLNSQDKQYYIAIQLLHMSEGNCSSNSFTVLHGTYDITAPFLSAPLTLRRMKRSPLQVAALQAHAFLAKLLWATTAGTSLLPERAVPNAPLINIESVDSRANARPSLHMYRVSSYKMAGEECEEVFADESLSDGLIQHGKFQVGECSTEGYTIPDAIKTENILTVGELYVSHFKRPELIPEALV